MALFLFKNIKRSRKFLELEIIMFVIKLNKINVCKYNWSFNEGPSWAITDFFFIWITLMKTRIKPLVKGKKTSCQNFEIAIIVK